MGSTNISEFAPVELGKEECNVDITVWASGASGVGNEEVGGRKRRIRMIDGELQDLRGVNG